MFLSFQQLIALLRRMPNLDPGVELRDSLAPSLASDEFADRIERQPTWEDVDFAHQRCHRAPEWRAASDFPRCHALVHFFRGDGLTDAERELLGYDGPDYYGEKSLWILFP